PRERAVSPPPLRANLRGTQRPATFPILCVFLRVSASLRGKDSHSDAPTLPRPRDASLHFLPGPRRKDRSRWLRRGPPPLARLWILPGIRRVPSVLRGRRPATRRLERLRPHGPLLPEALSWRDQLPTAAPARHLRIDGVWLPARPQTRLRALC